MIPIRSIVLAACLALTACTGCGATTSASLRAHDTAAGLFEDVAHDAKDIVLERRQVELNKAAELARDEGLPAPEVLVRVQAAADTYDAANATREAAVNAFINAKSAYVRTVLALGAKERPSWTEAKALLHDVVDAYKNLRAVLNYPPSLPEVPDVVARMLSAVAPVPDGLAATAPDRPAFRAPAGGVSWV